MIWAVTFNPSRDMTFMLDQPLSVNSISTAKSVLARAGGKGNNVARVARELGQDVTAVGFYGGDVGHLVQGNLEANGIFVLSAQALGETRTCLTLVGPDGSITEIRDPGPMVANSAQTELLAALLARVSSRDWVTMSGSLPPGLDPSVWFDWVQKLTPVCRGVIVDTSGANLRSAAAARPTLMVPNRPEWDASSLASVRPLVITEGADGVTWYPLHTDRVRKIRPPAVIALNTVGAGDAWLGGLVSALSLGQQWEEALVFAVAVASSSVMTPGVADVDREMVNRLLPQVQVL